MACVSASLSTPVCNTALASSGVSACGSSVILRKKRNVAISLASMGADSKSSSTCCVRVSSKAIAATAAWALVQNRHWLSRDTNAANSSRSPTVQADGPRISSNSWSSL
jgi:hypothetical protein